MPGKIVASELLTANKKLLFQNQEKEKREAELLIANKELEYQNAEKEKRAAELIVANKELAYQNLEKEKRAAELVVANMELVFQNEEKEKRAAELLIANQELIYQNEEKEKRAAELITAYNKIKKAEEFLREYIVGLEEMMFITHHKVRQPVANILGISNLLGNFLRKPAMLKKLVNYMKQSAVKLDSFTVELTTFMTDLEQKGKDKNLL
ncbi:MAG: diguanylate cyclase [Bacteroidota bacterium]